jgi:hypothetical protein
MVLRLTLLVVAVVGLGGCVKRVVTVPPEAWVTLAGQRASYRQWAQVPDLCAIDPRLFDGDVRSMNALLAPFLQQTSAPADGAWAAEHIALLEEAVRVLGPALALERASIDKASSVGCTFEGLGPAKELNRQAQKRLDEAPDLLPVVKARLALTGWKAARPGATTAAQEKACPAAPVAAAKPTKKVKVAVPALPVVYFAAEDEHGRLEWLFCDGAMVFATPGNPPALEPVAAEAKKGAKPVEPAKWLEAAAKYPTEAILRAPKIPRKQVVREVGPEPKDE